MGSLALGIGSDAEGSSSVAFGPLANALGLNSVAVGHSSLAKGKGAIAIGGNDAGLKDDKTKKTRALGNRSIAFGVSAFASENDSIAIGSRAAATVYGGVAIGDGSLANREKGVKGYDPFLDGESVGVGSQWVSGRGVLSVGDGAEGTRQITGVAAGSEENDAVNVAQLKALRNYSVNKFNGIDGRIDKLIEDGVKTGDAINWDKGSGAFSAMHVVGSLSTMSKLVDLADGSVSLGSHDAINGGQLFAVGTSIAQALGGDASYDGLGLRVNYKLSFLGDKNELITKSFTNVGDAFLGLNQDFNKHIKGLDGRIDQLIEDGVKTGDTINWDKGSGAFSAMHGVGSLSTMSKLVDLADGSVSLRSHDAINGGQLFAVGTSIAQALGGDASYDGLGLRVNYKLSFLGDKNELITKSFTNVGDAFLGLNQDFNKHIKGLDGRIDQLIEDGVKTGDTINWDKGSGAFSAMHGVGSLSTMSKLVDLADGSVSLRSHDAINGGQLFAVGTSIAQALGGDASYDGLGLRVNYKLSFLGDKNELITKSFTNVGDAFLGLNQDFNKHIKGLDGRINQLIEDGVKTGDTINWDKGSGAFSAMHGVGSLSTMSKLVDLADGSVSLRSHDAINGGQLFAVGTSIAQALGGDASYDGLGLRVNYKLSFLGDKNELITKSFTNVGDAFLGLNQDFNKHIKGLDGRINVIDGRINQLIEDGVKTGDTINWDKGSRAFSAMHVVGSLSTMSKLVDLADGSVSLHSHDAINGGQLFAVGTSIAQALGGDVSYDGLGLRVNYKLSFLGDKNELITKSFTNVGDAFLGLNQDFNKHIKGLDGRIDQLIEDGVKTGDTINWDKGSGAFSAMHVVGSLSTMSKLVDLADGSVSLGSHDAINGGQIFAMNNALAELFGGGASFYNGIWKGPTYYTDDFRNNRKNVEHNKLDGVFDAMNDNLNYMKGQLDTMDTRVTALEGKTPSGGGENDSIAWNKDAYDASHNGKNAKIVNVDDGDIDPNSKDAINGGQVSKIEDALNTKIDAVDKSAVKYSVEGDGARKVTLNGKGATDADPGQPVVIDNVGDGEIELGSHQAVNGGQLWKVKKDLEEYIDKKFSKSSGSDVAVELANRYTDDKVSGLQSVINGVRDEARQAAAIGLAVANLRYNDKPGKFSAGIGSGYWQSQTAMAFGLGYTSETGAVRSNLSVTTSGGTWGVGAGISFTMN
ncbi:YadA-like family protein [Bartonella sp. DGB2]|uniref:YadA-like family protein n=1 Tax=Bartonella sp. DGB2 TaxID=3388426 RepID=UPI00398FC193